MKPLDDDFEDEVEPTEEVRSRNETLTMRSSRNARRREKIEEMRIRLLREECENAQIRKIAEKARLEAEKARLEYYKMKIDAFSKSLGNFE